MFNTLVMFMALDVYLKVCTKKKLPAYAWKIFVCVSFVGAFIGRCLYWYILHQWAGFDGLNSCSSKNQQVYAHSHENICNCTDICTHTHD